MIKNHYEGFEKKEVMMNAFGRVRTICPKIKFSEFRKLISLIVPEFMHVLFAPRECVRKLKYIGDLEAIPFLTHQDFSKKMGYLHVYRFQWSHLHNRRV